MRPSLRSTVSRALQQSFWWHMGCDINVMLFQPQVCRGREIVTFSGSGVTGGRYLSLGWSGQPGQNWSDAASSLNSRWAWDSQHDKPLWGQLDTQPLLWSWACPCLWPCLSTWAGPAAVKILVLHRPAQLSPSLSEPFAQREEGQVQSLGCREGSPSGLELSLRLSGRYAE